MFWKEKINYKKIIMSLKKIKKLIIITTGSAKEQRAQNVL